MPSIRQRIASFLNPERRSTLDGGMGGFSGIMGGPTLAGPSVNTRTALGISAVWNAVSIYANTIASLNLYVAGVDERGGQRPARDHPLSRLVSTRPNPNTSSVSFRQSLMLHALTRGDAFAEIERNGRREPVALHLIEPSNVEPRVESDGSLTYRVNGSAGDIPARDMLHFHGMGWDGIRGYSPITLFRETLGLTLAEREHQSGIMGNSATAGGHIEIPGKLSDQAAGQFRSNWNAMHQGPSKAGNVGLLTGGAKWVQSSFSPADTELILSREFSIAEVARIFNIPQHMLGLLEHSSFSTNEEQNIQFYQMSIMPWLKAIEQEFNEKLLDPSEQSSYFVAFDPSSLLRGNLASQLAFVDKLFSLGMMSRNEGRMRFGLPPIEGGDGYYVASNNMTPVATKSEPAPAIDPDGGA